MHFALLHIVTGIFHEKVKPKFLSGIPNFDVKYLSNDFAEIMFLLQLLFGNV
jgi:hypothetical protein